MRLPHSSRRADARQRSPACIFASSVLLIGLSFGPWAEAAEGPANWQQASAEVITQLDLHNVPTFDLQQSIAVAVDAESSRLVQALNARLRGHLGQVGMRDSIEVGAELGRSQAAVRARRQGAEWLLWVRVRLGQDIVAEFLSIEPEGLWGTAPAALKSFGLVSLPLSSDLPAIGPDSRPSKIEPAQLSASGPALRIQSIEGRILALAACPNADGSESLAILTAQSLTIVAVHAATAPSRLRLDLSPLPQASTPTRDPIGQVICDATSVAFFHGQLAQGHRVHRNHPFEPWQPLPGMPHGTHSDGRTLVSRLSGGTNELRTAPVWVDSQGRESLVSEVWPPAYSRHWHSQSLATSLSLDNTYDSVPSRRPRPSGYGATSRVVSGQELNMLTATGLTDEQDKVRVFSGPDFTALGPWILVNGTVQSSVFIQPAEADLLVIMAVWMPGSRDSELQILNLRSEP